MMQSQLIGVPLFGPDGRPYQHASKFLEHALGRKINASVADIVEYYRGEPARMERLLAEAATLPKPGPIRARGLSTANARRLVNDNRERLAQHRRAIAHEDGRWPTATHEAGHAWCAWFVGGWPGIISIRPQDGLNGYAEWYNDDLPARQQLQIYVSGPLAMRYAMYRDVKGFSLQRGADERTDGNQIDAIMRRTRCGERVYREAVKRSQEYVVAHWPKIEAIARELVAREFIKGADVKRICESN